MARSATVLAQLAGQTRTIRNARVSHGFGVDPSDVAGLEGSITWEPDPTSGVPALPSDADFDRGDGTPLTIDWSDAQGTVRVATARLDGSDGDGLGSITSTLTDDTPRLQTEVEIRPVAATMPRVDSQLQGFLKRRVQLQGCWVTAEAMRQAGFHPAHALQSSAVAYHSMCGSAWPSPDPSSTYLPLGEVRQCWQMSDYDATDRTEAPAVSQGDDLPVMEKLFLLGVTRTRRNSSTTSWQLTVDLGTRTPTVYDYGRVALRPVRSVDGPGVRLAWTQTVVRVEQVMPDGTVHVRGSYARGRAIRWSVVVRQDGTCTVMNELDRRTGTSVAGVATALPAGSGQASYKVESPGKISAVSVCRSDSTFLVTQAVGAKITRSAFSGRWLGAFDYVPPVQAGNLLALQGRAEAGWRGFGLCQWIDEDGRLVNADLWSLARGPVLHTLTTDAADGTALDGYTWSRPGVGPWREVRLSTRQPFVHLRDESRMLLGTGSRETVGRGEVLAQYIHPQQDQTWLVIDTTAHLAGHPYPAPISTFLQRSIDSWVGGHRVDVETGDADGWITPAHVPEWSIDADGNVLGALDVLDPRTVLVSGTMAVPAGREMSTMPSPRSDGLPEHRKSEPLAQIRSKARVDWTDQVTTVTVTGDSRHPIYTHDGGMWVTNPAHVAYVGGELAASITSPTVVVKARVALNPRVRVGEKVELVTRYASGWTRIVTGVVAHKTLSLGDQDVMDLDVIRTSDRKVAPGAPLPPPDDTPPAEAPIFTPLPPADPAPPIRIDPPDLGI